MKKNLKSIILLVVLLIIATIIYFKNHNSTIREELKDFAVEDTASVDKIFMVDKSNQKVLLERIDGQWIVNNKYPARKDAMDILLKTINRLTVKQPVPKSAFNTIVSLLAAQSMKVEIYQDGNLSKTYYVGGPTNDSQGTYMMLENSSTPFIVSIQGFSGYLTTRYFIEEHIWRSSAVFSYNFNDITSITVDYPLEKQKSFKVYNHFNNKFSLEKLSDKSKPNFDTLAVKEYIASFKKVNFEAIIQDMTKEKVDSVLKITPKCIFTIENKNGEKNVLKTFNKSPQGLIAPDGKVFQYDPDRMYALQNQKDFLLIQYYTFEPLLKEIGNFKK
jgi:hypothetical protein